MKGFSILLCLCFMACASTPNDEYFLPTSDYPNDPWVKGYSDPDDCIGGEKLAAKEFALPDYPQKAFKKGVQGWVLLRLDVDIAGVTQNVEIEKALPVSLFGSNAKRAARSWRFHPPKDGALKNCRVLLRYKLGGVTLGGG